MTVMRYTLLRIMVFFGTLCLLYLVHLRGFWLIAVSLLGSMLISFFVLRRPREELSRTIAAKVDARAERAAARGTDEQAEDEGETFRGLTAPDRCSVRSPVGLVPGRHRLGAESGSRRWFRSNERDVVPQAAAGGGPRPQPPTVHCRSASTRPRLAACETSARSWAPSPLSSTWVTPRQPG